MSSISSEIWSRLEETRIAGDKLVARRPVPDLTDRLLCAVDGKARRHFLIPLVLNDDALEDGASRGVGVVTRELSIQGEAVDRYLDVECLDPVGHSIFDLMGGDFADALARGDKSPAEIVQRVLKKWRRFWGQLPQQLLTREEQLGLFAELWFLSVWLLPQVGPSAVRAWRGPFRSRHDFEWTDYSIEVKATTNQRGRIHRIHGLDQLEPPQNGKLSLYSLLVREESGATNNLPLVIESCRQQLLTDDDALTSFENALMQSGYSPAHATEYAKLYLRVRSEALFAVRDDFPRLVPSSFPDGLPNGVEQIAYDINIGSFDHLIIANSASEFSL